MDKSISSKAVVVLMIKDQLYSLIFSHIEKELNQEFQIKRVDINKLTDKKYDDLPDLSDVEGCVTSWGTPAIGEDLLNLMPKLKIVAHAAGSVKGVVEDSVYRKAIAVTSAHMALAPSVAETTLMLTLMGIKLYKRQYERFNKGMRRTEEPVGYELSGKRVGLIGYGRIARLYRKLLSSFDTEVLVYDPYLKPEQLESENVKLVSLDELLSSCHVISLHAPGTKENDSLIDANALAKMMDDTLIVNTARGILIDEDALYNELKTGRLRAALDVTREEPLPLDSPLRKLDNVILTPHIGGYTFDSRRHIGDIILSELRRFFAGEQLEYRANPEELKFRA